MRERAIVLSRKRGASERNDFCDANNRRRDKSKHSARNAECCGVCLAAVVVETTRLVGNEVSVIAKRKLACKKAERQL